MARTKMTARIAAGGKAAAEAEAYPGRGSRRKQVVRKISQTSPNGKGWANGWVTFPNGSNGEQRGGGGEVNALHACMAHALSKDQLPHPPPPPPCNRSNGITTSRQGQGQGQGREREEEVLGGAPAACLHVLKWCVWCETGRSTAFTTYT